MSSTFSIPVTFEEGKDGEYILVGEKGKLAFQIGSGSENETIELSPIRSQRNLINICGIYGEQNLSW